MTGYRYTASEVDAIIERIKSVGQDDKKAIFGIGFLSGFIAATILFGGALALGWLP